MANLLQTGTSWLADQLKAHASQQVIYVRGNQQVEVSATIGRTEFEIDDGSGIVQRLISRDYLIQATDLILAGNQVIPQPGDLIRETQGSSVMVYEVMTPGNEQHYRYSDPFGKLLRIHSKHVANESI